MKVLKTVMVSLLLAVPVSGCADDEPRVPGVCYCEFFKGEDQEYDLNAMTRAEQIAACEQHDKNAANFGGGCELE